MNESNTQPNPKQPTIQERLASGELTFVDNILSEEARRGGPNPTAEEARAAAASPTKRHDSVLAELSEEFGEPVITGNSFDRETQAVRPDSSMVGVYVTTTAFNAAKAAREAAHQQS